MASISQHDLVLALEKLLPPLDPNKVTFRNVLQEMATLLGVDKDDLKAQHKGGLKQLIPDMLHLCEGGEDKENEGSANEESEEEEEEPVVQKRPVKRSRAQQIQESDEEVDGDDSEEAPDDSEEEELKRKRRKKTAAKKAKAAPKPKATTRKAPKAADKAKDPEGIAALKELARAAGLMSPQLYAILKTADSEEEQESLIRERLDEAGIRFSSKYPKKADIAAAKRKKDKERELDGIDTSLIITIGRSRRASAPTSYVIKRDEDEEDGSDDQEGGEMEDVEEHDDESDAHEESDDGSDGSEAEF